MSTPAIRLQIPFGTNTIALSFNAGAELDVRILLRFARARAANRRAGFWLEYGWDNGDSQMIWIDPAHMPMAHFPVSVTPAADQRREDDMSRRFVETDHLYFTAQGWQPDTSEFAAQD